MKNSELTSNKQTYSEQLKSPKWQKMRLEILSRDNFTCQYCFATEKTLHVHHGIYEPNTAPWDHDPNSLVTLCHDCHESEEFLKGFDTSKFQYILSLGVLRGEISDLIRLMSFAIEYSDNNREWIRNFLKYVNEFPEFKDIQNIIDSIKETKGNG